MKIRTFPTTCSAAILALAWLVPSVEAAAGTRVADELPTREVSYDDLNMQSEAGVARLHSRIVSAAAAVCGGRSTTTLATTLYRKRCRSQAIESAVTSAGQAKLTRYHVARAGVAGP